MRSLGGFGCVVSNGVVCFFFVKKKGILAKISSMTLVVIGAFGVHFVGFQKIFAR